MTDLTKPVYRNDDAARRHLEAIRWPDGPFCPHCGSFDHVTRLHRKSEGLLHCRSCRKRFSVTVGTVFERSHIPLHKWLLATDLMVASKKGISAHQLHRMLGITYKSAWFMAHRLREAMRELNPAPMGGSGKIVEADETYIGGKEKNKHRRKRTSAVGGAGKEILPDRARCQGSLPACARGQRQDPAPYPGCPG